MGQAFQNQQEQNQELTALLEEREKEVVKNLEKRLLNAKKVIAELRAEVRRRDQPAPQEDPPASQRAAITKTKKKRLFLSMYNTFWMLYQAKTERKHSSLC